MILADKSYRIEMSNKFHQLWKVAAAKKGITMKDYFKEAVKEKRIREQEKEEG